MPYFSRLTDIVTCNLSAILADSTDVRGTLHEVIREMQEGVAGAQRSERTAATNVERISAEIESHRTEAENWRDRAKEALQLGNEEKARQAVARKKEHEHLLAGLEQQLEAATSTRNHLHTMHQALQARLLDAQRRLADLDGSPRPASEPNSDEIDAELASLRQELEM